jgi:beta-galactosidase
MSRSSRILYNPYSLSLLCLLISVLSDTTSARCVKKPRGQASGRERTSLNADWRFSRFTSNPDGLSYDTLKPWILPAANDFLSDKKYDRPTGAAPGANVSYVQSSFDDGAWEAVTLPHDWAITGTFDAPGVEGGLGRLPINGIGWYRRTLSIDADTLTSGKSVFLDVDGAMSYSAVWLNGHLVGGWPFGYNSFRLDLTPYAKAGENMLAIRLDNDLDSSRWYPGAGIYRNVWLVTVDPVHVGYHGTYITTPTISADEATVSMVLELENKDNSSRHVEIVTEVYGRDSETRKASGDAVAKFPTIMADVSGHAKQAVNGSVAVPSPRLWGPPPTQTPNEYVAISTLSINGTLVDTYETIFGIRSVEYDAEKGMLINGEDLYIQGSCNHHDLGSLGAAFNTRAAERQIEMLQEMGNNALRTSHNPPAPEYLDIADRLGLLVMDEIFDTWNFPKVENDFHRIFPEWHEPDLRSFIRRDRNHPSIISWSVGNELPEQSNSTGTATAKALQDIVHEEDPTRQVTAGLNGAGPDTGLAEVIDIIGLNYQGEGKGNSWYGTFPDFHEAFPEKMIWTTESSSTLSSRGIYIFPVTSNKSAIVGGAPGEGGDPSTSHVSSYDLYAPEWAASPDKVFEQQDRHPYVAGEFVWTGWDYIGEPTPYDNSSRSSYFGIIDLAGFKKDRFYLYQSRWRPDLPMAHILPHWTWPEDRVGEVTPVHVFTSGDEAELFINGVSAGRKQKGEYDYRLRWDNVTYTPGSINVVAYKDGAEWASASQVTAGPAASLNMTADRTSIAGDGYDLSFISVVVVDGNGTVVPMASNEITFGVSSGPGVIVSTDNGDPTDMTPFPSLMRKAFSGMTLAIVRSEPGASGEIVVEAKAEGMEGGKVVLSAV